MLLDEWQESYDAGPAVDPVAGGDVADRDLLSVTCRRAVRGGSNGGSVVTPEDALAR